MAAASASSVRRDDDEEGERGGAMAAAERALDPLFDLCRATPRLEQALALAGGWVDGREGGRGCGCFC